MSKMTACFLFPFLLSLSAVAQDWPNLSRFREENALLGKPSAQEKRIVFMGNSITEGWLKADSAFFRENGLINRGIGGQTTPQMLLRFRQDVIDLEPTAVFLLAGINDIAGNTGPSTLKMITDNITSMAMLAKSAGIQPVICSVLPANRIAWRDNMDPSDEVLRLNKWIKAFAKAQGFLYVDYYSSLADEKNGLPEKYSEDGVHPTREGYKVMETIALPYIQKIRKS